jgi:hypothetical protein
MDDNRDHIRQKLLEALGAASRWERHGAVLAISEAIAMMQTQQPSC